MCNGLLRVLFFLLLCQGVSAAETVYVHDQLRLGVRAEANSNESPITVVTTGAPLTVLEEQEGYLRVRTTSGVEGWVSKGYVSAELPARNRLENLQAQHKKLKKELDDLRHMLAERDETVESVQNQANELMSENAALHQKLSRYYSTTSELKRKYSWIYQALILIALFVGGVYIGIRWHKGRVAEKIGGLEI